MFKTEKRKLFIPGRYLVLAFCLLNATNHAQADSGLSLSLRSKNTPESFADIVEPLLPSVVNISTTGEAPRERQLPGVPGGSPLEDLFRHFMEENQGGKIPPRKHSSLGSGFIVAQKGDEVFIVTCNHVIADADEIKIILHDDETEFKAETVGRDRRTDLALLKIRTDRKLKVAEWGESSKLRVGDRTIAIGNPFGLSSTVTTGIVSTLARDIGGSARGSMADYIDGYIQTDASINMGNSGGPLFNTEGKVIAISTAIVSTNGGNIGLGFGIPSDVARSVINQLMTIGRTMRGWLGVQVQPVAEEFYQALGLKKPTGALVGEVAPQSPAEKAGIKTGDVILKFNGKPIKESRHLPRIVGESPIGKEVPITIWRNNKEVELKIMVGEFEKAEAEGLIRATEGEPESTPKKQKALGMAIQDITPGARERFNIPTDVNGVLIGWIDPQSEAAEKGIRPGDVILEAMIQDKKIGITNAADFLKFVSEAEKNKKKQILLLISRRGTLRFIALSTGENGSAQ